MQLIRKESGFPINGIFERILTNTPQFMYNIAVKIVEGKLETVVGKALDRA